jgi:hypothetical protein
MIKTEIYTGEEIAKKWPEVDEWIRQCHFLSFEIDFDVVPVYSEAGEVMDYHDSGIREIKIRIREFSENLSRIKDDSRPLFTK